VERTINVEGLPEPLVRSLEAVAELARRLVGIAPRNGTSSAKRTLNRSVRKGTVVGKLTREEIYEDRV
jgi:hypothetical protein